MKPLTLDKVSINYGERVVLNDLSHHFEASKIHVILGKSGSGKSTLLKAIAKLIDVREGTIDGNAATTLLFQDNNLFDWLTVLDNVALPLINNGISKRDAHQKAFEYLENLNLSHLSQSYPHTLSGGEKQRIGLVRALALSKPLLLLDEPTSALDSDTSRTIIDMLLSIQEKEQVTMLYVTHRIEEAIMIGETIAIMHDGIIIDSFPNKPAQYGSTAYWDNLMKVAGHFHETTNR